MSRHLHAVRSPDTWPPIGLRELGERIAEAAGVIVHCDRAGPYATAEAAAVIIADASRAEVLIRKRREVPGQLILDHDDGDPGRPA